MAISEGKKRVQVTFDLEDLEIIQIRILKF